LIKKQLNKTLEDRIEQRTREIQLKSKQYRTLFENTPSAIAEIDFSQVLKLMKAKNLHSKDVFLEYIESDPEIVRECLLLIRYIGANSAHLNLYKISDINDFYNFYASMQDADSLRILGEEIAFLLENESTRSYETVRQNSEGIKMNVLINWVDISEIEYSFSRVILSTTNVTYLRKIESELIMHQNDLESIVRLRTEEIEKLNYTLQNKNGELNELNSHLENEVNKRTIHLRLKNEQLANYAFKNAHNVRGSLARMLGLLYLYEIGTDVSDKEILDKLGIESKAMDLILQQISNELYQNSTEF
jgi:nitrate/nitrite-specific signal transduction histidine kinase